MGPFHSWQMLKEARLACGNERWARQVKQLADVDAHITSQRLMTTKVFSQRKATLTSQPKLCETAFCIHVQLSVAKSADGPSRPTMAVLWVSFIYLFGSG